MTTRPALVAFLLLLFGGSAMADESGPAAAELQKCKICHSLEKGGANRVGPNLFGIFGRKAGSVAGFNSSEALKNSGVVWDDETMVKFLRDPKGTIPGNRMSFPGISDDATLTELVRQLKQATQ